MISYTIALEFVEDDFERFLIQKNRAEAHLNRRSFDGALADADSVPKSHPLYYKALFRSARASYELGQFEKAEQKLKSLVLLNWAQNRDNEDANRNLARIQERRSEESGVYDFKKVHKLTGDGHFYLDHALYQRIVKVQPSEGRRYGLFITKAVQAGELLLCEKAFAVTLTEPGNSGNPPYFHLNFGFGNYIAGRTYPLLVNQIVQKLYKNPSLQEVFNALYAGDYERTPEMMVDGKPVIDTYAKPPLPV